MFPFFLTLLISLNSWSFDWQGHRGARGTYPENTIGAMKEALRYPVTTLELDVVISQDKKVVVSHEPWMNSDICLDPKGQEIKDKNFNLYKMNYEEIVKFDCGSKPHPRFLEQKKIVTGKPLLETLIQEVETDLKNLSGRELHYNIEIKSDFDMEKRGFQPDFKTFSDLVIKTVKGLIPESRFTIQSFDQRVLKYIHEKNPEISLSFLVEEGVLFEVALKELGFIPQIYSPPFKDVTLDLVKLAHDKKMKLIPWTVNSVEEMRKLKSLEVDGIITDYPHLILEAESKKCKRGFNFYNGFCVFVPRHAVASDNNPGWVCKKGYHQTRNRCHRITIPPNSVLMEDGKTWVCQAGFQRYRGTCKKD